MNPTMADTMGVLNLFRSSTGRPIATGDLWNMAAVVIKFS
jgi:hypothetical protein